MNLTEAQREAVTAPASVAVTAGAGTGKTQLLAERFCEHLTAHGLAPLEIVVATFTEKAAAELRARIRERVAVRLPGNDRFLAELEAAQIGTLHSLAARICREHPEAAGVPADFQVLDEQDGRLWMAEQLEEALGTLDARPFAHVPFSLMRAALTALLADPLTAEQALAVPASIWPALVERTRGEALQALLADPVLQAARAELGGVQGAPTDKREEWRQRTLAALQALDAAARDGGDPAPAFAVINAINLQGGSAKAWPPGDAERAKEALREVRDVVRAALGEGGVTLALTAADDELARMLPGLQAAFEHCRAAIARAKRERGLLDFADLEVHAVRALADPAVVAYYAARWRAYMIDEFQDTNPVQAQLLDALTAGTRVTVVGDEKQSIYGFRRADVEVFRTVRQQIAAEGGRVLDLARSFRTHAPLVAQFNTIFEPLLGGLHQPLEAARALPPHALPPVQLITCEKPFPKHPKAERVWIEARAVAEAIQRMLADGMRVHAPGGDRPVRPEDVAILARVWEPLERYADALSALGIPAAVAGGGDLMATREAQDLWALLRFLADPSENLALAAVLRGPWFAVADPDLDAFARPLARGTAWWPALKAAPPVPLARAVAVLGELLAARAIEPPSRLLQLADRRCGYTAVIARLPGAARRAADYGGMLALVRQFEVGAQDVFQLVRRLQRLMAAEVEFERPFLEPAGAVSLMTIHRAKGLEWPVVVMPDLGRRPPVDAPKVRFEAGLGVALRLGDVGDDGPPQAALYTVLAARAKRRELAERMRVFYVGCTRARDLLLLTATEPEDAPLRALLPGIQAAGVPTATRPFDPAWSVPTQPAEPPPPAVPPGYLLDALGPGLRELPVTALGEYERCPQRFRFRYVDGHPGLMESGPGGMGAYGARVGTLVHLALEHGLTTRDALAHHDSQLPAEQVDDALRLATAFRQHPAYAPLRAMPLVQEQPFRLPLGPVVLNGVIDAVGPDFVLDFKTDGQVQPAHHRLQLWAYAQAARKPRAVLAYLRHDRVHEFPAADLAEAGKAARAVVEGIAAGRFDPAPSSEACGHCPFVAACDAQVAEARRAEASPPLPGWCWPRPHASMDDGTWQDAISRLRALNDGAALWALLPAAPVRWAAPLLQALSALRWTSGVLAEDQAFAGLVASAVACRPEALGAVALPGAGPSFAQLVALPGHMLTAEPAERVEAALAAGPGPEARAWLILWLRVRGWHARTDVVVIDEPEDLEPEPFDVGLAELDGALLW